MPNHTNKTHTKKHDNSRKRKKRRTHDDEKSNGSPTLTPAPSFDSGLCGSVSQHYEKIGRIGEGTYGVVYKARHRNSQRLVALKRCIPHHVTSDGFPLTTLREIQTLRHCHEQDYIVDLLDIVVSASSVFLVFEYCEHDLAKLLDSYYDRHKKSPFSQGAVKTLMKQLLTAVDCLHDHHIIHRDIKLSNLLYTHQGVLKLADFGLSRSFSSSHPKYPSMLTPNVASLWYRPPELLWKTKTQQHNNTTAQYHYYDTSMDLWAIGCAFCELLQGYPPMNGRNELEQIQLVIDFVGQPPSHLLPTHIELLPNHLTTTTRKTQGSTNKKLMLDQFSFLSLSGLRFLTGLLEYDTSKRWTTKEALQCDYLNKEEDPLPLTVDKMPRFGVPKIATE
jgi:serine/threonine protein kinase